MTGRSGNQLTGSIDWWSVLLYALLVGTGWLAIYSAGYNESAPEILDLAQKHGMQLVWIGIAFFVAVTLLLLDDVYFHMFAYPAYWISIALLLFTLMFGREVNGAKAWLFVGNLGLQPAEFVKYAASLAVARYMSRDVFNINDWRELFKLLGLIFLPAAIIIWQNDTGSAVVFASFLLVLYHEGLSGWMCLAIVMAGVVFILSLLLTPAAVTLILLLFFVALDGVMNRDWRRNLIFTSAIALGTLTLYFGISLFFDTYISIYLCLLLSCVVGGIYALIYAYKARLRSTMLMVVMFGGCCLLGVASDYVFDNVLQTHQQKRILHLLGLESDPQTWGYNVNQSEIAIGSGGFLGKGFLAGTQTRYDFVPEQGTDFIFSTVGEQWGFLGAAGVVVLFALLIFRLIRMGDRQREPFRKIYCYSVAAIFFTHVIINIGMTIGVMPVIGIPLPFFSYGGSSFLAFTLLFFTAVKLDAGKRELLTYRTI